MTSPQISVFIYWSSELTQVSRKKIQKVCTGAKKIVQHQIYIFMCLEEEIKTFTCYLPEFLSFRLLECLPCWLILQALPFQLENTSVEIKIWFPAKSSTQQCLQSYGMGKQTQKAPKTCKQTTGCPCFTHNPIILQHLGFLFLLTAVKLPWSFQRPKQNF